MTLLSSMFSESPFAGKSLVPFLAGKKTYLMAATILGLGVLESLGVHVPVWILTLVGAGTVAAHKASIDRLASVIDDIGGLVTYTAAAQTASVVVAPPSATDKVHQVTQTPAYRSASETEQTEMLNESQSTTKQGN